MSDRLAVMNHGSIEQVGSPADVYEHPATSFVAGFVGVSNTLSGEAARRATGTDAPITIRPEKIHLLEAGAESRPGEVSLAGKVREVVYLGAVTRYVVDLDLGGQLVVLQQNLQMSSMDVLKARGRPVVLAWARQYVQAISEEPTSASDGGGGAEAPREEGE